MNTPKGKDEMFIKAIGGLETLFRTAVSKEDLKDALDVVAKFIRAAQEKLEKDVRENTAQNKVEMERHLSELSDKLKDTLDSLNASAETYRTQFGAGLDEKLNELRVYIGYVESCIKDEYDDGELRSLIRSVEAKIPTIPPPPKPYDDTEVKEDIEELEKKVEELDKKIVTGGQRGGGMTDRGLQYAMNRIVQHVTPTGTIDGVNKTFTVPSTIHAILSFELNSRVIALGEYTITGGKRMTIEFDTAPSASYAGKSFVVTYL